MIRSYSRKAYFINFFLVLSCIWCCIANGCIKDPPLNPEADIETFTLDTGLITTKTFIDQSQRKIRLYLTTEAYNSGVTPVITISKHATVTPASGDSIHPKDGIVTYTVTSETGQNKKIYTVEVVNVGDWSFEFEDWQTEPTDQYQYPVEPNDVAVWSSGNPGVALSGVPKQPDAYPTQSTADGYNGTTAAKLTTIKGTALSELVGIFINAGSLFIGDFNSSVALINPLAATEFGEPYVGRPDSLVGYYKYTPGAIYWDEKGKPVPGLTDECSIYAVYFKGPDRLNGSNVLMSDKVLAMAKLADGTAKSTFTKFKVPFIYNAGWDSTATNLMVAIVASSSKDGDHYKGAVGSTLVIDSVAIIPK